MAFRGGHRGGFHGPPGPFGPPPPQMSRKRGREDDFGAPSGPFRGPKGRRMQQDGPMRGGGPPASRPVDRFRTDFVRFGDDELKFGHRYLELDSPPSRSVFAADIRGVDEVRRAFEDLWPRFRPDLIDAFASAVFALPHKLPHLAAVLAALAASTYAPREERPPSPRKRDDAAMDEDAAPEVQSNVGRIIIEQLVQILVQLVEDRRWRSVRLLLHLFAHLASLAVPLVDVQSLVATLGVFATALEPTAPVTGFEDDIARAIAECYARIEGETRQLPDLEAVVETVRAYAARRRIDRQFVLDPTVSPDRYHDPVGVTLEVLLDQAPSILPRPYLGVKASETVGTPALLLVDRVAAVLASPSSSTNARPSKLLLRPHIFDDDTVPAPHDPNGVVLRTLIQDLMDIFEVNRREAAGHLISLARWFPEHFFKPIAQPADDDQPVGTWIPEHILVETILGNVFDLPSSAHKSVYYHTLLVEITKLSPKTIAPAMGKSVRRLYAGLGSAVDETDSALAPILDVEGSRRFSEWFGVHLSNFNFLWRWPEWEGDLTLPLSHPKRAFIARTLELEIRLCYFDRIRNSLPEPYKAPEVVGAEAPGPSFSYESDTANYHAQAMDIVQLIRDKTSADGILTELDVIRAKAIEDDSLGADAADELRLDIAVQTILLQGSRSFSHLLNVLERYVTVLTDLSKTAPTRRQLLRIVGRFWRRNDQFLLIAVDKLLQYRIVEPADVLGWVFDDRLANSSSDDSSESAPHDWSGYLLWDVLRSVITKVEGRVSLVSARLEAARRAHRDSAILPKPKAEPAVDGDDATAAAAAMDELEPQLDSALGEDVANAERQLAIVEGQLESVIVDTVRHFARVLGASADGPGDDNEQSWSAWWLHGWFREFCRSNCHHLARFGAEIDELDLQQGSLAADVIARARRWTGRAIEDRTVKMEE